VKAQSANYERERRTYAALVEERDRLHRMLVLCLQQACVNHDIRTESRAVQDINRRLLHVLSTKARPLP
jgi:hypothetical protein